MRHWIVVLYCLICSLFLNWFPFLRQMNGKGGLRHCAIIDMLKWKWITMSLNTLPQPSCYLKENSNTSKEIVNRYFTLYLEGKRKVPRPILWFVNIMGNYFVFLPTILFNLIHIMSFITPDNVNNEKVTIFQLTSYE